MNPQEILPSPEKNNAIAHQEANEAVSEQESAMKTEHKSGPGSSAITAMAVDDAQNQVQGAMSSSVGSSATAAATQLSVPEIADDVDLIEKEWVKKAKEIVHATQGDPHEQTNQINKMKVEYIKKRYGKDIKFKEE